MSKLHRNRIFSKENADYHIDQSKSEGLKAYRESRPEPIYAKMSVKDRIKVKRNKPWWYLTKSENIAIENTRKTTKMTKDDYITGYVNHKLEKWKHAHPEPRTDDLFYKEEHPKWVSDYESYHDKVVGSVKKYITQYNKRLINFILSSKTKYSMQSEPENKVAA